MKILILCTGNSCRSQMAEGYLRSLDAGLEVFSAGIDISGNKPKNVNLFVAEPFDYVITVCGGAKEVCPAFTGDVKNRLHIGFDDPADATGTEDDILNEYRRIRDEIKVGFSDFYNNHIKK
ncbi:MAG: arsenate reductase ArsC [Bacteroidetes bacterium]|nr:arsenate reductase ArsC [Bacteroidota bacterium]